MSIISNGFNGAGGGAEWSDIMTWAQSYILASDEIGYQQANGGYNSESVTATAAKPAWDGTFDMLSTSARHLMPAVETRTTLLLDGVLVLSGGGTGTAEVHVVRATKAGMGYGDANTVACTSVGSFVITNPTGGFKYEVNETISVSVAADDRLGIIVWNGDLGGGPITFGGTIKLLAK